ncbi:MAG: hypothetical protein LBN23_08940 [Paludibacter sp.]|jgi:hypothetical protein|nr:hypothetical protein [Paludibacter sp.]
MKKILILALLFIGVQMFAQDDYPALYKQNELKINVGSIIYSTTEFTYERLFNDIGVGASLNFGFGGQDILFDNDWSGINYGVIPYFRLYFGNGRRPAAGFFLEANAALASYRHEKMVVRYNDIYDYSYTQTETSDDFRAGIGVAGGFKWVTGKGFTGEVFLGLGRMLGVESGYAIYPRCGLSFGKRF